MGQNKAKENKIFLVPPLPDEPVEENSWLIGMWLLPGKNREDLTESLKLPSYHWDNRSQLESDTHLIQVQIANVKKTLYPLLNNLHGVNHSARYWDILLGEWIYGYVQIIFDRWRTIKILVDEIESPNFLNHNKGMSKIPFDTDSFFKSATTDHYWNANLFRDILDANLTKNNNRIDEIRQINYPEIRKVHKKSLNWKLSDALSKLYTLLMPHTKGIILQTPYLDSVNLVQLCFKLKALIYFETLNGYVPSRENSEAELRSEFAKLVRALNVEEPFFRFLLENCIHYLPAIYLEDYKHHKKFAVNRYFNYFPKIIVTANSHYSNETWKSWAATARETGTRIVLLQHGGHYGHSKFSLIQNYEIELADNFLSWGWTDPINKKVKIAPATKLIGLKVKHEAKKTCLVVTFENSTYSAWLASIPVGPQVISSREMTIEFLSAVTDPVKNSLRVRAYPLDYGLNQREVFKLQFPTLSYSASDVDFKSDLRDVRIVVFNYFSTSFIEAVKSGIPSVAFVNPDHWEVSDSFKELFSSLVNVGILHHSPKSCAQFVMQTWGTVDTWWSDSATIEVVKDFLEAFGYTGSNPIGELSRVILDI